MSQTIRINQEKCIGCQMCIKDCPNHAIRLENGKANMYMNTCMECGHCYAICPKQAITMVGYDETEVIPTDTNNRIDSDILLNAIKSRRSIRQFHNKPVEKEKLEKIIEAGRFTPTGTNRQHNRYIIMENPSDKIEPLAIQTFQRLINIAKKLDKVIKLPFNQETLNVQRGFFFHEAPIVIFVISDDEVDAALASTNMATMAETQGLGLFFVGLFVTATKWNKTIQKRLKLKGKEKLVTAIAIGYPSIQYQRSVPRKKVDLEWM